LLFKKTIIFLHIIINQNNLLTKVYSSYYKILVPLFILFYKKYKFQYTYVVNIKVANRLVFNSCIIFMILMLRESNFSFFFKFIFFKNTKSYYSPLRSAFIHATSREHFFIKKSSGQLLITFNNQNIFTMKYLDHIFNNFMLRFNILNIQYFKKYIKPIIEKS
jgi:hypothetical protein